MRIKLLKVSAYYIFNDSRIYSDNLCLISDTGNVSSLFKLLSVFLEIYQLH